MALTNKLSAIGDAIRAKNGTTDKMSLDEMATAIGKIETGGLDTSDATATADDILSGKTAYVNGEKVTGNIGEFFQFGAKVFTPTKVDEDYVYASGTLTSSGVGEFLPAGKNIALGLRNAELASTIELTAEKIVAGNTVLGIEGTGSGTGVDTADATATADDILESKTAYVNGEKITGTVPKYSSNQFVNVISSEDDLTFDDAHNRLITATDYFGKTMCVDPTCGTKVYILYSTLASKIGLVAGKLVKGNTILGIEGTADTGEVISGTDTSDATATADDILSGKTAYVNGEKLTGALENYKYSTLNIMPSETVAYSGYAMVNGYISEYSEKACRVKAGIKVVTPVSFEPLVAAIGLTSDQIVSGNTVLGVAGTGGGTADNSVLKALVEGSLTEFANDEITYIRPNTFAQLSNLTTVSCPNVTNVGGYGFNACPLLTTVSLPEATTLGDNVFLNCTGLTTISLPKVTSMGLTVFAGCTGLTSISLPEITEIADGDFSDCKELVTLSIPKVTTLGDMIFGSKQQSSSEAFVKLTTFEAPLLETINQYGFAYCLALKTVDVSSVKTIGSNCFEDCKELEEISLPAVTTLDGVYNTFRNALKLKTVRFGDNITHLGVSTFYLCASLTKVIITNTSQVCDIVNISSDSGAGAFANCYHFYGIVNETYNPDGLKDGYIYVPDALVDSYKTADEWKVLASQIKPLSELSE